MQRQLRLWIWVHCDFSRFPPGSFRLTEQDALARSDIWRFVLWPPGGTIQVKFATHKNVVSAELKLNKPITGLVREIIAEGNCGRALAIDDDALQGDLLKVVTGTIRGNIRGRFALAGHTYRVLGNRHIESADGRASGFLQLEGNELSIYGTSIRLPGAGEVRADLKAANSVVFSLAIATLEATLLEGKLDAGRLVFLGPIDLSINDLAITAQSAIADDANLVFLHGKALLDFRKFKFPQPRFSYTAFGKIGADDVLNLMIDNLSGSAELESGIPTLNIDDSRITDAEIKAKDLRIENQVGEALVSGEGEIKLSNLTADQIGASIQISKPTNGSLSTAAFVTTISTLTMAVSGRRDDPKIIATGKLSTLQLGNLKLKSAAIPFHVQHLPSLPASVKLTIAAADFDIYGAILGNLSDGTIEASIASLRVT